MRRLHALLLAGLLVMTGCLGDEANPTPGDPGTGPAGDELSGFSALYLDAEGGLGATEPGQGDPASVPVVNYYDTWATERDLTTWTHPGFEQAVHITSVTVDLFVTAEQAAASSAPGEDGTPEFGFWLGVGDAVQAVGTAYGPDTIQAGDRIELTQAIQLPKGGLVAPAGTPISLLVGAGYAQGDASSSILALVDSQETPSRIVVETQPIELTPADESQVLDESGTLISPSTAVPPQEGVNRASYALEVPPGTTGVRVLLERTDGVGAQDLDLDVLGPDGERVAGGLTPKATEQVWLFEPNIQAAGTGTWTVEVTNFGHAQVDFRVQAWVSG